MDGPIGSLSGGNNLGLAPVPAGSLLRTAYVPPAGAAQAAQAAQAAPAAFGRLSLDRLFNPVNASPAAGAAAGTAAGTQQPQAAGWDAWQANVSSALASLGPMWSRLGEQLGAAWANLFVRRAGLSQAVEAGPGGSQPAGGAFGSTEPAALVPAAG